MTPGETQWNVHQGPASTYGATAVAYYNGVMYVGGSHTIGLNNNNDPEFCPLVGAIAMPFNLLYLDQLDCTKSKKYSVEYIFFTRQPANTNWVFFLSRHRKKSNFNPVA